MKLGSSIADSATGPAMVLWESVEIHVGTHTSDLSRLSLEWCSPLGLSGAPLG